MGMAKTWDPRPSSCRGALPHRYAPTASAIRRTIIPCTAARDPACIPAVGTSGVSPVIYASEHYSTALLETLARTGEMPRNQHYVEIDVAAGVTYEVVTKDILTGWSDVGGAVARAFGSAWFRDRRSALLIVPSVVARMERNVLIHPYHDDAKSNGLSSPATMIVPLDDCFGGHGDGSSLPQRAVRPRQSGIRARKRRSREATEALPPAASRPPEAIRDSSPKRRSREATEALPPAASRPPEAIRDSSPKRRSREATEALPPAASRPPEAFRDSSPKRRSREATEALPPAASRPPEAIRDSSPKRRSREATESLPPGQSVAEGGRDGWEAGIRTPIPRSRAACPTVERPPSNGGEP